MRIPKIILILCTGLISLSLTVQSQTEKPTLYNPAEDARVEMKKAITKAKKEGKHVLLQVGGNW